MTNRARANTENNGLIDLLTCCACEITATLLFFLALDQGESFPKELESSPSILTRFTDEIHGRDSLASVYKKYIPKAGQAQFP
jgi:hypothetical protein